VSEVAPQYVEERRLHPSTLVQRIVLSIPGLIILTLPLWTRREGPVPTMFFVILAGIYLLFTMPLIIARYVRFRYWITPRELVIRSGVLTRQHRSIPIERIQNVEIHQPVVPRLFGTARVKVETAGSAGAEGVIEFVSLEEARRIRTMVREYARQAAGSDTLATEEEVEPVAAAGSLPGTEPQRPLLSMPFGRVLLSGAYRFSLLYILIIFSGIQYLNVQPEEILDWLTGARFGPLTDFVARSPLTALVLGVGVASLFSWFIGILVNVNKFYRFQLAREGDKLYRRHGLLTVLEGNIPLQKVQAVIFRANALMRRRRWLALKVQTMGLDPDQQGHQIAVPFARPDEVMAITPEILPFTLPGQFDRVSKLTIRRHTIRYTLLLVAASAVGSLLLDGFLWMLAAWPLLPLLAYFQYRNHGYAFDGDYLFVRRGVFVHHVWVLPVEKFQVLYRTASVFQRRLDLATVYVDTAGAASLSIPEIVDLPAETSNELLQRLHAASRRAGSVGSGELPF
jgi:putative membrane protein